LITEAGFPPGVINIINEFGEVKALLASHMQIQTIGFTCSATVRRKFQEAAAESTFKLKTLELGGNSTAIIFTDANMGYDVAK
jgi:aldehyde dehydrogenase (NAD+)